MHETLDELLHRRPFEPFEIFLSNGNSYAIRHPEVAHLLKTKIVINSSEGQYAVCFLLHIAEIRLLKHGQNGAM
jgi:hypothetical protein